MRALLELLPHLSTTIVGVVENSSVAKMSPEDAEAYIRAIKRKTQFALMHRSVLEGIDWQSVDDLGRTASTDGRPTRLTVKLHDAILELHHPGAVIDHVYVAFDGLTAALINITDTFARLVNAVYGLGINERQASLLAVRDQCTPASALGVVLNDALHTDWLRAVRDLRGRCQHADVEDVLTTFQSVYASRPEPLVSRDYTWSLPKADTPIVAYARAANNAAESTLVAVVSAILACSNDPTK